MVQYALDGQAAWNSEGRIRQRAADHAQPPIREAAVRSSLEHATPAADGLSLYPGGSVVGGRVQTVQGLRPGDWDFTIGDRVLRAH